MITKSLSIILLVQLIGHITSIQHIHDINEVQNNSSLHLNKTSSSLLNEFSINSQNLTQWEELVTIFIIIHCCSVFLIIEFESERGK